MSRKMIAAFFGVGLAFAAGCGSNSSSPTQPDVKVTDGKGEPQGSANPSATVIRPGFELDPAKHVIPTGLVSGTLGGESVAAEATLEGRKLVLQKLAEFPGDPWRVQIDLPPEALAGAAPYRLVVKPEQNPGLPIMVEFPKPVMLKQSEVPPKVLLWNSGCALTLELTKRTPGVISGKLYLSLSEMDTQDESQRRSFLAGTFEAPWLRPPTDIPTAEDVPFVNGTITVRGVAPGEPVRIGYAATPTPAGFPLGGVEIELGDPVDPPRWAQTNHDKPRVSSLIAGNAKDVPSRYELSKLTPNRYLVFASLKDGPAAWKWVTVLHNDTINVDFTIDATQTGGLEVVVPAEVLGKMQIVPAEDPGQPAITPDLFVTLAVHMRLERDIKARKVLYKNLAPGHYEVRAGGRSRLVEIVPGKISELDLDKQPPLPAVPVVPAPEPKPKP